MEDAKKAWLARRAALNALNTTQPTRQN